MSLIFLELLAGIDYFFASINPPRDRIKDKDSASVFFCNDSNNNIDIQTGNNCASYATAYVLRSLGEQTDGEDIIPEMNRIFGVVPVKSIIQVLKNHGYVANAYSGNIDTLKQRLTNGVPIVTVVMIVGAVLFPEQILSLFTSDKTVITSCGVYLLLIGINLFSKSGNIVIGNAIRGSGNTKWIE